MFNGHSHFDQRPIILKCVMTVVVWIELFTTFRFYTLSLRGGSM